MKLVSMPLRVELFASLRFLKQNFWHVILLQLCCFHFLIFLIISCLVLLSWYGHLFDIAGCSARESNVPLSVNQVVHKPLAPPLLAAKMFVYAMSPLVTLLVRSIQTLRRGFYAALVSNVGCLSRIALSPWLSSFYELVEKATSNHVLPHFGLQFGLGSSVRVCPPVVQDFARWSAMIFSKASFVFVFSVQRGRLSSFERCAPVYKTWARWSANHL